MKVLKKVFPFSFPILLVLTDFSLRFKFLINYDFKQFFFYFVSIIFSVLTIITFALLAKSIKKLKLFLSFLFAFIYTYIVIFSIGFYYYSNIFPNYYTIEYFIEEFKNSITIFVGTITVWSIILILLIFAYLIYWFNYIIRYLNFDKFYKKKLYLISHIIVNVILLFVLNNNIRFVDQTLTIDSNLFATFTRYYYNKATNKNFGGTGLLARNPIRLEKASYNKNIDVNVLVIVFESLRKQNLSLYGYYRKTTPFLDSIVAVKGKEFFIFQNTFTTSTTTMLAIPALLTGITPYQDPKLIHSYPMIWDYGKILDKKNFFITSQSFQWYNLNIYYSNEKIDFLWNKEISGHPNYNDFGINDKLTVNTLINYLNQNNNFFGVFQFNTNHYPYKNNLKKWDGERIDDYDNTILLQDSYIKEIFTALEKNHQLDKTIVILVGDHGEAFGEHKQIGHRDCNNIETLAVPFVIYIPEKYHKYLNINELKKNTSKITTNADLVPTLLDLFNLNSKQIIQLKSNFYTKSLFQNIDDNRYIITLNNNSISRYKVGVSIIDKKYHYLYKINTQPHIEEIYEWPIDRAEQNNLIEQLTPEIIIYYKKELMKYPVCKKVFEGF